MISVIIPSYKEPCLNKTIQSLLDGAEGDIEIIAVLDGYWPDAPLPDDMRVKILHFGKNRGMRAAINGGVGLANGKYIMKTDGHCLFAKGWDIAITAGMEDTWVVTPRRYALDPVKWEVMEDVRPIDYDKLIVHKTRNKFHGEEWRSRAKEREGIAVDETMCLQGSCWIMARSFWDEAIGELEEEGYGTFVMEPVEIAFKTWASGGKLMVNKRTWYAHKHRSFNRTHNVDREAADRGNAYALEKWGKEYEIIRKKWGI